MRFDQKRPEEDDKGGTKAPKPNIPKNPPTLPGREEPLPKETETPNKPQPEPLPTKPRTGAPARSARFAIL